MNFKTEIKKISDEVLVEKIARTRDTDLFEELYDRYEKIVYNKCYGFSSNAAEAEDLTQDVFLKLYLSVQKFNGKSKFSTWLYAFTYNFCVNYINRDRELKIRRESVLLDENTTSIIDVEDEYLFQMKADRLEMALKNISPGEKMILLLKYQDEVSIKELQKLLNLGESAVKMRLSRAKSNLIAIYNQLDHEV